MPVPYLYYDVDFYLYQVYEMQLPRIIKYMYTAKGQPMPAVALCTVLEQFAILMIHSAHFGMQQFAVCHKYVNFFMISTFKFVNLIESYTWQMMESAVHSFCICFHPLDQRDAVSWVEMDHWKKQLSKEAISIIEVVLCHIQIGP